MHTPILRYHGGKFRLAKWIHGYIPKHRIYVETHGGAGSVLLQKERSHGEVYNDLDRDIFNLFLVLRDEELNAQLVRLIELTPYSRDEFKLAYQHTDNLVERARRTIVRSAMGFGSGAANFHQTGFRCEAKRQYSTSAHCWAKYPPVLAYVLDRLKGVNIENRPAELCIDSHDSIETHFYADPPYVKDTRKINKSGGVYQHEMSDADHEQLLNQLNRVAGTVSLSGYNSDLYNDLLPHWVRKEKPSRISAGKGTKIKTECLWLNPQCVEALKQAA